MKKRVMMFLSVLLISAMFLQIAEPGSLSAASSEKELKTGSLELIQEGALTGVLVQDQEENQGLRSISGKNISIEDTLYQGMFWGEEKIDLSSYRIPKESFGSILQDVLNGAPDLFYVEKKYMYWLDSTEKYVLGFVPSYKFNGVALGMDEIHQLREEFWEAADAVLSTVDPEWSDLEKALYIHDYLASQYEYDTRSPQSTTNPCHYDAYSLIVEGRAVCEGYSLAYLYFMKRLDIPCSTVASNKMNHMWNQVQIGGKWYHVDVTHDDPLSDIPGRAQHMRFLLSDAAMTAQGYSEWDSPLEEGCTDSSYDRYFWQDSEAPFVNCENNWYFVRSSGDAGIYRWDPSETENAGVGENKVVDLTDYKWQSGKKNSYYSKKYTGLAKYGENIYFNTPNEIRCVPVSAEDKTSEETVFSVSSSTASGSGILFGIRIKNNVLEYVEGTSSLQTESGEEKSVISTKPVKAAYTFETSDAAFTPPPIVTPEPPSSSQTPGMGTGDLPGTEESPGVGPTDDPASEPSGESPTTPQTPVNPSAPGTVTTPISAAPSSGVSAQPIAISGGSEDEDSESSGESSVQPSDDKTITSTEKKILSQIKISAKKNRRSLSIRVPQKSKVVVSINKKLLLNKKKKCKKLTISAAKNKSGKITVKLSSRLPKKTKVTVTVSVGGKNYKKTVRV
ncbi:MAG: hypothetical protein NC293_07795 [Roseburia sp.]|nr:hypothetical protein [Roseburia sp.]